jgi:ribosome maturation protein SDO1
MISLEEAVVARIAREHSHFEILVDPDLAMEMKKGKDVRIEDVLAAREIFKDSKKGERASEEELKSHFHTTNTLEVAEFIIRHGEIQLTTEQRRKILEEKKRKIADIISRNGIDPKTNAPHPQQRILNAMEEAHVHLDINRRAEDQVEEVLSKIQEVIPISMERVEVAIRIPVEFAGKASSVVREMTKIKSEEWKSDAWIAVMEMPAGMQAEMLDRLNSLTHGKVESRIVKKVL